MGQEKIRKGQSQKKSKKMSKFWLMRMRLIKTFYIFVPYPGESYCLALSATLGPFSVVAAKKTDFTIKNSIFIMKIWQ